ncbi:MAG: phage major capsid protein, partial [Pirellulales bacterium]|nr:phage major capsid protein [Pirellulales bacterium]
MLALDVTETRRRSALPFFVAAGENEPEATMALTATEHREKHVELINRAQALNEEKADDETGLLAAEYQQQFNDMIEQAQEHIKHAKGLEAMEGMRSRLEEPIGDRISTGTSTRPLTGISTDGDQLMLAVRDGYDGAGKPRYTQIPIGARGTIEYQNALSAYLRGGDKNLSPEQYAALQSDDADQAGYLVTSEQMAAGILREVDDLLFIRQHARIHTVRDADSLGIRKRTARASTFNWSAELQTSTEDAALKYGKKVLTPHHLTGKIKVSRDLLRRSVVSVDGEVRSEFARDSGEV